MTRADDDADLVFVPVSYGELFDKITILKVKAARFDDPAKLANVRFELERLEAIAAAKVSATPELQDRVDALQEINAGLWDIENGKRDCEARQDFGPAFIDLARRVYIQNDTRARLKREINELTGSRVVEEKQHTAY